MAARVVYEESDWSICTRDFRGHVGIVVYANHTSCTIYKRGTKDKGSTLYYISGSDMTCWYTGDRYQTCLFCDAKVPDSIQTLIVLYQTD